MSRLRAAYHEMYLVTKNVYLKVLDCIDETSRRSMEELNRSDEDESEERRPSEEFFDDLSYHDIESGVSSQSIPIQEGEQEYGRQRVLRPMLTYEPDLPPIREALRSSYGDFQRVPPLPSLRSSTYPRLFIVPPKQTMDKQSEIIRKPQAPMPPPRPIRRVEELREQQYPTDFDDSYYTPRTPRQSESSQSDVSRISTSVRQRPPVRVRYQDEGLETIQDCARGISSSICRQDDLAAPERRRGGFQCDLCKRILSTKHSLNRHILKVHKSSGSRSSETQTSQSEQSFSGWDRPSTSTSMETGSLPGRGERKRAFEEYETDEDVPLSKHYAVKAARRKRQQSQKTSEQDPEGSGRKDNFETWQ